MLAEAYELEVVSRPCARVRVIVPREGSPQPPRALSREEIDRLLAFVGARHTTLVLLLRWTGLRVGEALGLRWSDLIDGPGGPVLTVRRQLIAGELLPRLKTDAGLRDVPVVPLLARELERAPPSCPGADSLMFLSRRGRPVDAHNLRRELRRAAQAADVGRVTPHTLRHTLATELLLTGHDASVVARVLGHRSAAFTRRVYVHVDRPPRFDSLAL